MVLRGLISKSTSLIWGLIKFLGEGGGGLVDRNAGRLGFPWRGSGTWPFTVRCGQDSSAPDLPGQQTPCFWSGFMGRALVKYQFFALGWRNSDSRCPLRSKSSPLCMFWLHSLRFCSVVSGKQVSISLKWGQFGAIGSPPSSPEKLK